MLAPSFAESLVQPQTRQRCGGWGGSRSEGGGSIHHESTTSAVADALERRLVGFCEESGHFQSLRPTKPVEVSAEWYVPKRWTWRFNAPIDSDTHNTISEVRAVALAVMHATSATANWDSRLACFSDAGAAIGCYSKGRSSSWKCNFYCRQVACCSFVANIRLYLRWVASEHNCADGPSRGLRRPGVAPETVSKAKAALAKVWDAYCSSTSATA